MTLCKHVTSRKIMHFPDLEILNFFFNRIFEKQINNFDLYRVYHENFHSKNGPRIEYFQDESQEIKWKISENLVLFENESTKKRMKHFFSLKKKKTKRTSKRIKTKRGRFRLIFSRRENGMATYPRNTPLTWESSCCFDFRLDIPDQ